MRVITQKRDWIASMFRTTLGGVIQAERKQLNKVRGREKLTAMQFKRAESLRTQVMLGNGSKRYMPSDCYSLFACA